MKKIVAPFLSVIFVVSAFVGLFLIEVVPTVAGETVVNSPIDSNTTWNLAGSPYRVTIDVQIFEDVTLIIEAGVLVKFDDLASLQVKGNLTVQGNAGDHVVFRSSDMNSTAQSKWDGIYFHRQVNALGDIRFSDLSNANYAIQSDGWSGGSLSIADSLFRYNYHGVYEPGVNALIERSTFENNFWGIYYTPQYMSVYDSTFKNNTQGMHDTNKAKVYSSYFENNGYGIERAWIIKDSIFVNNDIGVSTYTGEVYSNNTISNNGIGIHATDIPGYPVIECNDISNNTQYNFQMDLDENVDATKNWWGTTNTAEINASIEDAYDDGTLGIAFYEPFLISKYDQGCNSPVAGSGSGGGGTPPSAPENMTVTGSDNDVSLMWDAPQFEGNSSVTDYYVYRGTSMNSMPYLSSTGGSLGFTDSNLTTNTAHFYMVRAVNGDGPGASSIILCGSTTGGATYPDITTTDVTTATANELYEVSYEADAGPENGCIDTHDIAFVMDSSGSMTSADPDGDRIESAAQFVQNMTNGLDRGALIDLDSSPTLVQGLTSDLSAVEGSILSTDSSGGTNVFLAFNMSVQELKNNGDPNKVRVIILLTDDGGNAQYDQLADEAAIASSHGILLYAVGIGDGQGSEALLNAANITGGSFYSAANTNELYTILPSIASELDALPSNESLTWSLWTDSSFLTIEPNSSVLSGTPTSADVGTWQVNVTVTDDDGDFDFHFFNLTVQATSPGAPTNLTAQGDVEEVDLNWDAPVDDGGSSITNFKIYRGTTSGSLSLYDTVGYTLSYLDSNVTGGTTYYYAVSAVNGVGEGPQSAEENATPQSDPGQTPSEVLNLIGVPGDQTVQLDWEMPASDGGNLITNYKIFRGTSSGSLTLLDTVGNVLTYNDGTVSNDVTYFYHVLAMNSLGDGPASNEISATPTAPIVPPGAPENLTAMAGNAIVTLSWLPPSDTGGGTVSIYTIYRGIDDGNGSANLAYLVTVGNILFSYDDGDVTNGITYFYMVTGVNEAGEGVGTPEVSVTPAADLPSSPQNLTANGQINSIHLEWANPSNDGGAPITNFNIYRQDVPGIFTILTSVANVNSFNDSSVVPDTLYSYVVTAVNSAGESLWSNEVSAMAIAEPNDPPLITTVDITEATEGELYQVDYDATDPDGIEDVTLLGSSLPTHRYGSSAIWDGKYAYIFGGLSPSSPNRTVDEIVQFDPLTGTVIVLNSTLPSDRFYTSAVWDGQYAYIFGGYAGGTLLDEIVRFDPSTGDVTILNSTLPTGRGHAAAIWDGQHAYIFGGFDGGYLRDIVRFDPSNEEVLLINSSFQWGVLWPAAIWDGQFAYTFGGYSSGSVDDILRFDPMSEAVTSVGSTLPTRRYGPSAAWDGEMAYVFGGNGPYGFSDEIVRFNPSTEAVDLLATPLPTGRMHASSIWDGQAFYIFGGNNDGACCAPIVRFTPGDTMTWSLSTNAPWLSIDPSTGVLNGTPPVGSAGTYGVSVSVDDGKGGLDFHNFTLTIAAPPAENSPPMITNPDVTTATEGELYAVDYDADDLDGDPLAWSLNTDADFLVIDDATGILSGSPGENDVGLWTVTISADDGNGGMTSRTFELTVSSRPISNYLPVIITSNLQSATEGTNYYNNYDATDEDNDIITWRLMTDADFLSINPTTGELQGTPGSDDVGSWSVTIIAEDDDGGSVQSTFDLSVAAAIIIENELEGARSIVTVSGDATSTLVKVANPAPEDQGSLTGVFIELQYDGSGQIISSTITLTYDLADVSSGQAEDDLGLYRWDESRQKWDLVEGSSVDASANEISADVQDPGIYTIRGATPLMVPETVQPPANDGGGLGSWPFFMLGVAVSLGAVGLLLGLEWLAVAIAGIAGVLTKKDTKNNLEMRGKIQGIIEARPGVHYRWIQIHSGASNGACTYHLRKLEKEGIIKSRRDGMFKRFYPGEDRRALQDSMVPEVMSLQAQIIEVLKEHPGASQTEIGYLLDESPQKINYHIMKMRGAGEVNTVTDNSGKLGLFLADSTGMSKVGAKKLPPPPPWLKK